MKNSNRKAIIICNILRTIANVLGLVFLGVAIFTPYKLIGVVCWLIAGAVAAVFHALAIKLRKDDEESKDEDE